MRYKVPEGFSIDRAERAQRMLALKVKIYDDFEKPIRLVGGADVAWRGDYAIGCVTVHEYPSLTIINRSIAVTKSSFPYIPTFLSFREIKPLVAALAGLKVKPTILFVNGQGIAHPRRLGLASHLGLVTAIPTIGVAQKVLYGRPREPLRGIGYVELLDETSGEVIGYLYRGNERFKPICISVGHKVSLETSLKLTTSCSMREVKLPIPLHTAHLEATKEAKKLDVKRLGH
ncbi:MAG: endonuclease V [Candidatus Nezhaarchaeota archaeon]|nr:endonuclease V [Candidatus Nezhaarchaeota archaeon]MCX8141589.1 endonuclease V [Candidatus Nezhaarchaeota archaeon]MDW8049856.1 endonuclease V [Nitrososphaerota archaeon]